MFGRSLRARCAIELFREIPARRRVRLHGAHEHIAALECGVCWVFAAQTFPKTRIVVRFRRRCSQPQLNRQFEIELGGGERSQIPGVAAEVSVFCIAAEGRSLVSWAFLVDRIFSVEKIFECGQCGLGLWMEHAMRSVRSPSVKHAKNHRDVASLSRNASDDARS